MDIAEFLLARIAEDEADLDAAPSSCKLEHDFAYGGTDDYQQFTMGYGRAVAECEAKRMVIVAHAQIGKRWVGFPRADRQEAYCIEDQHAAPCDTLRALAIVYRDHPDYQQAWALT